MPFGNRSVIKIHQKFLPTSASLGRETTTMDPERRPSSITNKLFLSGSDLHTPVGDETHTPSSRPPVNGTSTSSVGTFTVKAGLAQMLKICLPLLALG
jgi:hypothetical protein